MSTAMQTLQLKDRDDRTGLPLHYKFAMVGSVVTLIFMLLIGWWVSQEIEGSVTRNSAISTALYMESFIAPLSQELSSQSAISPETTRKLNALADQPHFAERIASIKLWKPHGLVVFASNPEIIGKTFKQSRPLQAAWRGELSAVFDDLNDEEDAAERQRDLPFLEVYNPIYSIYSGEIIAVAEFYQIATELNKDLFDARLKTWAIVAGLSMMMFGILFGIVLRGSRLIDKQSRALEQRFRQLTQVSSQNDILRHKIQLASAGVSELNERYLGRISAELHDGPAQSVALASLRVESIGIAMDSSEKGQSEVALIKTALDEALSDIRNICRGLSLPQIEDMAIDRVIHTASALHEQRTQTQVAIEFDGPALDCFDHAAKICTFRFVQEALNNAFQHAGGVGQSIHCQFKGSQAIIRATDDGPGFDLGDISTSAGLGLHGLRQRIESQGGNFYVDSKRGRGTSLTMIIDTMKPSRNVYYD